VRPSAVLIRVIKGEHAIDASDTSAEPSEAVTNPAARHQSSLGRDHARVLLSCTETLTGKMCHLLT
jgi:hypothetical protein